MGTLCDAFWHFQCDSYERSSSNSVHIPSAVPEIIQQRTRQLEWGTLVLISDGHIKHSFSSSLWTFLSYISSLLRHPYELLTLCPSHREKHTFVMPTSNYGFKHCQWRSFRQVYINHTSFYVDKNSLKPRSYKEQGTIVIKIFQAQSDIWFMIPLHQRHFSSRHPVTISTATSPVLRTRVIQRLFRLQSCAGPSRLRLPPWC